MAQADFHDVFSIDRNQLLNVIRKYEDYPQFVDGCNAAKIIERKSEGLVRVQYELDMMSQNIHYVLDHVENLQAGTIEWKMVESNIFKKNEGSWKLVEKGPGKTEVTYRIELEFKIPVPGFILNRLIKGSLPSMVKGFEKRARSAGK